MAAGDAGLATAVQSASVDGVQWYRLVVTGLPTVADGEALMKKLAGLNYRSPWISNS